MTDLVSRAIYATAHDAGLPDLSRKIGIGEQVLRNKVNFNNDSSHINVNEAMAMMLQTKDLSIINAMCAELGGKFVPDEKAKVKGIVEAIMRLSAEHGDVQRALADAMADGTITDRERGAVLKEIDESIDAHGALKAELMKVGKR